MHWMQIIHNTGISAEQLSQIRPIPQ